MQTKESFVPKIAAELSVYGSSDIGRVRATNEDSLAYAEQAGIFIVADGLGGHSAGEVASRMACDTVLKAFTDPQSLLIQESETQPDLLQSALVEAFKQANRAIFAKGQSERSCARMGTTLDALLVRGNLATFAHVGDSRIYLWRDKELKRITHDHSLSEVLLESGAVEEGSQALASVRHTLTRAIGTHNEVEVDSGVLPLSQGDLFLLCTDGLINTVPDETIARLLSKKASLESRVHQLIRYANQQGGVDNITAILVHIHDLSR